MNAAEVNWGVNNKVTEWAVGEKETLREKVDGKIKKYPGLRLWDFDVRGLMTNANESRKVTEVLEELIAFGLEEMGKEVLRVNMRLEECVQQRMAYVRTEEYGKPRLRGENVDSREFPNYEELIGAVQRH
jgi:hypothetical protein